MSQFSPTWKAHSVSRGGDAGTVPMDAMEHHQPSDNTLAPLRSERPERGLELIARGVSLMAVRVTSGGGHVSIRRVRNPGPWQWTGRQVAGLAHGAIGAADCRRGASVDRRLLSQRRLSAQQE